MESRNFPDEQSLKLTISELSKVGRTELVHKLDTFLKENDLSTQATQEQHVVANINRILSDEELEIIVDLFHDLEVFHVGNDNNTTRLARLYAGLADEWAKITPKN